MKKIILSPLKIILTVCLFSAVSVAAMSPFIVNGRPVQLGENYSAHTVGLGDHQLFCTGVIISSHHILTAAHCKDGLLNQKVYFGLGPSNFEFRTVTAVTAHPDYCKKSECGTEYSKDDFDILVVEFSGDLPFGFTPVEIASKSHLINGVKIHLAGYGMNEFGKYDDTLNVTEVPFDHLNGVAEFRTIETDSGSCSGDSGGPAYIFLDNKLFLAGLTSRGDGPCRSFGIYTLVDYFSEWILDTMTKPSY